MENPFQKIYDPEYIEEKTNLDKYREIKEKQIKIDQEHYFDWMANLQKDECELSEPWLNEMFPN